MTHQNSNQIDAADNKFIFAGLASEKFRSFAISSDFARASVMLNLVNIECVSLIHFNQRNKKIMAV